MTTAQRKLPPIMDVDDFLSWPGDGTGARYELVDGVLRAMAPPSDARDPDAIEAGGTVELTSIGAKWPIENFYAGTVYA